MVGAVGATGRDDAQRRLLRQHGAGLNRGGVGTQHARRAAVFARQVKGIVIGPGGMMRGDVQGAEIVPVALGVRPLGNGKAHCAENGGHLVHRAADRMDQAGVRGAWRKGRIQSLGRQARIHCRVLECRPPTLDCGGQGVLQLVERGAALAPLFGRGLAELLQQAGQGAVLAEHGDADGIPGTQIRRGGECRVCLSLQGQKIVGHDVPHTEKGRPVQAAPSYVRRFPEETELSRGRPEPFSRLPRTRRGRHRRWPTAPCGPSRCRPASGRR